MKNIKKELETAIKTGKVIFGSKKVVWTFLNGNPKLVLVSKNCPFKILDEIRYYAKIAKIPCITLNETSYELGSLCGKPFQISSLCIIDEGESSILDIVKVRKGK